MSNLCNHSVSVRRCSVAVLATLIVATACREDTGSLTTPIAPAVEGALASVLTADAATHLGVDGKLRLGGPAALGVPQIDSALAGKLAKVWAFSSASMVLNRLEQQYGANIDVSALRSCGETVYARSTFALLPPTEDPVVRRGYGPYWIVTLCGAALDPEVSVAVSALATDLSVKNGRLTFPQGVPLGEYFHWLGIPIGQTSLPIPPETAALAGAQLAHRKIASVPELVITGIDLPGLARWHLALDSASAVGDSHAKGGITAAEHLYVSLNLASGKPLTTTPSATQPDSVRVLVLTAHPAIGSRYTGPPQFRSLYLHRLQSYPVALDTVTSPTGGE